MFEQNVNLTEENIPRIQAHLRGLVQQLRAVDVAHLTAAQREQRQRHIERLDAYWREGVFPQNRQFAGLRPVFVDDGGRACAVADLMIHSGAQELATEVSRKQNFAYLGDIEVPGVSDWIAQSGLTAEECAMIQPGYPCSIIDEFSCSSEGTDVTIAWHVDYEPDSNLFGGYIMRDGIFIFSFPEAFGDPEPEIFVDENLPPGTYLYEFFWEEVFECFDTATCTVIHENYSRGDINQDGIVQALTDGLFLLNWGFLGGEAPYCMAAADIDGDGQVAPLVDALYFLTYQFSGGASPPEPFANCGALGQAAELGCDSIPVCP